MSWKPRKEPPTQFYIPLPLNRHCVDCGVTDAAVYLTVVVNKNINYVVCGECFRKEP